MKLDFLKSVRGGIKTKSTLVVLSVILIVGIVFSVIQITKASPAAPNPGHTWAEIEKPADCPSGEYVYGAGSGSWKCRADQDTDTHGGLNCTTQQDVKLNVSSCTSPSCPSGYIRTGCSGGCTHSGSTGGSNVVPMPSNNCRTNCTGVQDVCTVYVYCCKIE